MAITDDLLGERCGRGRLVGTDGGRRLLPLLRQVGFEQQAVDHQAVSALSFSSASLSPSAEAASERLSSSWPESLVCRFSGSGTGSSPVDLSAVAAAVAGMTPVENNTSVCHTRPIR